MALVVKDRVQETSTTTGTGTFTLSGAPTGFQTFSSAIGNGNTTYYTINLNGEWEVGIGTVGAGTLSRDTVLESSNAGSLVNFSAGTKLVFCTYPAERSVTTDAIGVTIQAYDADTTKNDVANTFTANQVISITDNTNAALRITQLGTGNALVVEDSTNPDATPFIVDAKGNVGVGATPNANWDSGGHIDFSGNGGIWSGNSIFDVGANGYYNGTNWIYKTSSFASSYGQNSGAHIWYVASSGTAGNAITFNEKFRIANTGALAVNGSTNYGLTGQVLVSQGNTSPVWKDSPAAGPAFGAYASTATQTINIGTWTKVLFQTEEFDTNSNFSSSRFTPTTEGYYQLNACVAWSANSSSGNAIAIYKNGTIFKIGSYFANSNLGPRTLMPVIVYANGSTDYFEVYVINNTAANLNLNTAGQADTWFNGSMVRGA